MAGTGHNSRRPIQTVFRAGSSQDHYTIISNKLLKDPRLKSETRGFVARQLSYPKDWMIKIANIVNEFRDGREKVYRMIREATELGYMGRLTIRDAGGQIIKYVYYVTDDPENVTIPEQTEQGEKFHPQQLKSLFPKNPKTGPVSQKPDALFPEKPVSREPVRIQKKNRIQKEYIYADFEKFWKAYPNKNGKAKARERWKGMTPEERKKAIAAVEPYKKSTDPKFYQWASTWLNQSRWEDFDGPGAGDRWFDHPKAWELSEELYLKFIQAAKPNGAWLPDKLGPLAKWKATPNAARALEQYKALERHRKERRRNA